MAWVLVGLGNPGEEYNNTRHNAGRMAVSLFAEKHNVEKWRDNKKTVARDTKVSFEDMPVTCVLPDTFMNKSGSAVLGYVKSIKAAEKMVVVYDDLDLPLGTIKLSFDRGSGGHKGLDSIMRALKTKAFCRIRIGVSPHTAGGKLKKPSGEEEVVDFILATFKPSEKDELKNALKRSVLAMEAIISKGFVIAMNEFNTR